ncbi:MAG: hypothetical protein ACYDD4_08360 [Acidimicrobiales bacterium]
MTSVEAPNGSNGRVGGSAAVAGRRAPGPTVKPAAIVFGIILVIFLVGMVADAVSSSHSAPPRTSHHVTAVAGTGGLVPTAAASLLGAITTGDQPPSNVIASLVIPHGTRAVPGSSLDHTLGLFDRSMRVQVPATATDVIAFFRAELPAGAWKVQSAIPQPGGSYQFIAQHPGSDGYEWEVGLTLASTFASVVPQVTVPGSGATVVTIRLYASSDES